MFMVSKPGWHCRWKEGRDVRRTSPIMILAQLPKGLRENGLARAPDRRRTPMEQSSADANAVRPPLLRPYLALETGSEPQHLPSNYLERAAYVVSGKVDDRRTRNTHPTPQCWCSSRGAPQPSLTAAEPSVVMVVGGEPLGRNATSGGISSTRGWIASNRPKPIGPLADLRCRPPTKTSSFRCRSSRRPRPSRCP